MPSLRRAAAVCAVLVLPLAGCTLDPYGTASASPSAATTSASTPAPTAPTKTASPVSETTQPVTDRRLLDGPHESHGDDDRR